MSRSCDRDALAPLAALLRAADGPTPNLDEVLAALRALPVDEAELLRVADAARYGMTGRVSRLERVVSILGVRAALEIGAAVWLRTWLATSVRDARLRQTLWSHALHTATACELLAETLGLAPGPHFVHGLLHDLGIPLLAIRHDPVYIEALIEAAHALAREPGSEYDAAGRACAFGALGLDDSELGALAHAFQSAHKAALEAFERAPALSDP